MIDSHRIYPVENKAGFIRWKTKPDLSGGKQSRIYPVENKAGFIRWKTKPDLSGGKQSRIYPVENKPNQTKPTCTIRTTKPICLFM